jgi:hypothetical protein
MNREESLAVIHQQLGYRRQGLAWAKVEILLSLLAVGIGVFLGQATAARWESESLWHLAGTALALFVLGGYLTLAGHRSHLYHSGNERTAWIASVIQGKENNNPIAQ